MDLLEAAFLELSRNSPDDFTMEVLSEYIRKMDKQSEYMNFLSKPTDFLQDILLPTGQCVTIKP